jgi:hypothetical protein
VAVIVTLDDEVVALVVTAKVAVVLPAAIVTLAGTLATRVLLVFSVMAAPPVGAALLMLTRPVADVPPTTLVGLTDRDESFTVVIVNVAVLLTPL